MKLDEFAFFNQQLAGMLKAGIPLEGALGQLSRTMRDGPLRDELQRLEADLAKGVPLPDALSARQLPELYTRMISVGVAANNLPGVLTMLADYYHRVHAIWTRLKALMVYPGIVLVTTLIVVGLITWLLSVMVQAFAEDFGGRQLPAIGPAVLWAPLIGLSVLTLAFFGALAIPGCREWLRWRLPAFKEAGYARFASSMSLLLQQGGQLRDALALMRQLEKGTAAGAELERWEQRLAGGQSKFADLSAGSRVFPPLFVWLVSQAGEDLAGGFGRAAEIYYHRAVHRMEMLLYAALPVSVMMLGIVIVVEVVPLLQMLALQMDFLGSDMGGS
jgi:type II secretory pathway component PulF